MRLLFLLFFFPIIAFAEGITIDGVSFAYRVPAKPNENSYLRNYRSKHHETNVNFLSFDFFLFDLRW